ncbi:putative nucleotidyltransferase with HDIG domain [Oikeobacillus pervagus]|uniref:Nucleotidyltransferase with HDIG domain n=1 Tax=Oikeobacillus pervagus TaxID=1325931 RepID=A0AAJ1T5Q1_9BACI|nr:HD-GYP domain-containing protein [Oikeobacillus pervagus]MDQ0215195.1 putative nucleotidyltransferase with HDIG domain [Oikeobacillus pervagus]
MRLKSVESLQEDEVLAKPIYNEKGRILIKKEVPLKKYMIERLKTLGVSFVYIHDPNTNDVVVRQVLSDETRQEAIKVIKDTFELVQNDLDLSNKFIFDKIGRRFSTVVRNILQEIRGNHEAISLLSELFSYDQYIFTHSLNVTIYSLALAVELNQFNQKQLEEIGLGAMLHDIGKVFIPKPILMKPGGLTDEEYAIIQQHTVQGFELLRKESTIPLVAAHCAFQHHERLNGSGYPRGLKGDEIHIYARIMAVADVYDAVTSNRVYRKALLPHDAFEILFAGVGKLFEKEMVESFRRAIIVYPNGLSVHLNDGRKGIVVSQSKGFSDRPVVRILEEDKHELLMPYEVDMSKDFSILIDETDITLIGKKADGNNDQQ